ncbi:MAG: nitroreductase family protein [Xenococcaceae cyanobacterium MO_188.B32]|nr:nitroreductase family protein [Xenococcaceae cyanobacterium MO_188.B32]
MKIRLVNLQRKFNHYLLPPFKILQIKILKAGILALNTKKNLNILENYIYDIEKYITFSTTINTRPNSFENLTNRITAYYHVIEKGLAFKDTRLGYGKEIVDILFKLLERYLNNGYPINNEQFISAIKTLESYCKYHNEHNYDIRIVQNKLEKYKPYIQNFEQYGGGTKRVYKEQIIKDIQKDFEHLAYSRHSIRNFIEGEVDIELIKRAILIAQKSPSVCNRQSSRVYILKDEQAKKNALSCQNGNRGFGHLANKVLIVTSNLKAFYSIKERNQAFIDGGMFGMSLIYALHSLGLGTCTLNWSTTKEQDIKLRSLIAIKSEEVVIFMIAVGLLPESLDVPYSQRKNLEEIIQII